mmetsp:Transcript_8620/g.30578  ORF Transcript_8620/g.30578 Transcript_8620/m.30578 type:complete len:310 (+) Transcript_8620:69-998(+)
MGFTHLPSALLLGNDSQHVPTGRDARESPFCFCLIQYHNRATNRFTRRRNVRAPQDKRSQVLNVVVSVIVDRELARRRRVGRQARTKHERSRIAVVAAGQHHITARGRVYHLHREHVAEKVCVCLQVGALQGNREHRRAAVLVYQPKRRPYRVLHKCLYKVAVRVQVGERVVGVSGLTHRRYHHSASPLDVAARSFQTRDGHAWQWNGRESRVRRQSRDCAAEAEDELGRIADADVHRGDRPGALGVSRRHARLVQAHAEAERVEVDGIVGIQHGHLDAGDGSAAGGRRPARRRSRAAAIAASERSFWD